MRSLLVIALLLAACSPDPTPTTLGSTGPLLSPSAAPSGAAATSPSPASTPAHSPAAVAIPAPFDAIPWAHYDSSTRRVSIGVIGKPAITTRPTTNPDSILATGTAVLVEQEGETEIVDARTGSTIARFRAANLRPPQPDGSRRPSAHSRLLIDIEHGYLYQLDSNALGMRVWRFLLDGSGKTVMAVLAPDPDEEFWIFVDVALDPTGVVVALACPPEAAAGSNHRCRVWRMPSGVSPPFTRTYLPAHAPVLCHVLAVTGQTIFGTVDAGCGADGGAPTYLPFAAIDLVTGRARVETAPSSFEVFAARGTESPYLIGNSFPGFPGPKAYPAVAATLEFTDSSIGQATSPLALPGEPDALQPGWVWALRGAGPDWLVAQSFGPEWAACHLAGGDSGCPAGAVVLSTELNGSSSTIELPTGTWGEILPPSSYVRGANDELPPAP